MHRPRPKSRVASQALSPGIMTISNQPTRIYGGGDGKHTEIRTKKKNDKARSKNPTVDTEESEQISVQPAPTSIRSQQRQVSRTHEKPLLIREGASKLHTAKKRKVAEAMGKGKSKKQVESDSKTDSSDDDDRSMQLAEGIGEQSAIVAEPEWQSKFVSRQA